MSSSSNIGYYVRQKTAIYGAEYPLSVNEVQYMANNAKHLRDEATQHRVNWCIVNDTYGKPNYRICSSYFEHAVTHVFPWTLRPTGYPVSAVLRVKAYAYETYFWVIAILSSSLEPSSILKDLNDNLFYTGNYTVSSSPAEIINGVYDMDSNDMYKYKMLQALKNKSFRTDNEYDVSGLRCSRDINLVLLRLTLYTLGKGNIASVMLREYNG